MRVNSTFLDYDENDCQKYSSLWWFSATSHSCGQSSLAAQRWTSPRSCPAARPVQSNSEFYSLDVHHWPAFWSSGPGLARVLMAINVCWDLTKSLWSGRAPSTPLIHYPSHYSHFILKGKKKKLLCCVLLENRPNSLCQMKIIFVAAWKLKTI